jgi:programmed cell death protein 4
MVGEVSWVTKRRRVKISSLVQGHVEDAEAKKALCRADTLLNMKHGMVRLDNVWGVGGGIKPVKYLVSSGVTFLAVFTSVPDQ